jgi:nicotinamide N-methyltransferase
VLFLSDLLHFDASHGALLSSVTQLLSASPSARVYVGAGKYTPAHVCAAWVRAADVADFASEEIVDAEGWRGSLAVAWSGRPLDVAALSERKANCRLWTMRWR